MSNPSLPEEQLLELLLQLKVLLILIFSVCKSSQKLYQKTTPDSARAILNSQPQIAYALITLMVNMNAINVDVLHVRSCRWHTQKSDINIVLQKKTVATYGAQAQPLSAPSAPSPMSSISPHVQGEYRTSAPPNLSGTSVTPLYPYSNGLPQLQPNYGHTQSGMGHTPPPTAFSAAPSGPFPSYPPSYAVPLSQSITTMAVLPDALAAIPDDQKAVIVRVLSMTSDQINQLPPTERANVIQLVCVSIFCISFISIIVLLCVSQRATLGLPSTL
jgi:cleavage stimulation factor subunit 2